MFNKDNQSFGKFKPLKILFFAMVFVAFLAAIAYIVMLLWNAILPDIANVKPLNFWQAAGLLVLAKILFGGFGGRRGGWKNSKGKHWKNKWMNMSDEERQGMKSNWKNKWMNMSHEERQEAKSRWKEHCRNKDRKNEL